MRLRSSTFALAIAVLCLAGVQSAYADDISNCNAEPTDATTAANKVSGCTSVLTRSDVTNKATVYALRGTGYAYQKNYKAAIADFTTAIKMDPSKTWFYSGRAEAYYSNADYLGSIPDYNKLVALEPTYGPHIGNRGDAYFFAKKYREAISDFTAAIALKHTGPLIYSRRGQANYNLKNYSAALPDFEEALRLKQDESNYAWRADTRYSLKNYSGAIEDYNQTIALNPSNAAAVYWRGMAYENVKNPSAAMVDYDRAVALKPDVADYQNGVCWIRASQGIEMERARTACNEAIRLMPKYANAYDSRGMLNLKQGRVQEAWNDYNTAAINEPTNAWHFYGRGIAAVRLGRNAEGQADMAKGTKMDAGIAGSYSGYGITPTEGVIVGSKPAPVVTAKGGVDLESMGAGELFARADELDQAGKKTEARTVRRKLIAKFPDSPLAAIAAQKLN